MIYGTTTLYPKAKSIVIIKSKSQIVRHFPGTNSTNIADLGRMATRITCVLMVFNDAERIVLEQLLHSEQSTTLKFNTFFYKDVSVGKVGTFRVQTTDGLTWFVNAEFIATDAVPYDITTEEALY